jgi:protein SCO1/2
VNRAIWAVAAVAVCALPIIAWMRTSKPSLPDYGAAPALPLIGSDDKPLDGAELHGRVWVVDFVFTHCPQICPRLTAEMKKLENRMFAKGWRSSTRLVSISVDPENDKPDVLAAYAKRFDADPAHWKFLTATSPAIEEVVVNGFKQGLERVPGDAGSVNITHGSRFGLVDCKGRIRGLYDSAAAPDMDRLVTDIGTLVGDCS